MLSKDPNLKEMEIGAINKILFILAGSREISPHTMNCLYVFMVPSVLCGTFTSWLLLKVNNLVTIFILNIVQTLTCYS